MESEDKTNYDTFYSHSKAEKIINESDIDDIFKSIYTVDRLILINIQNIDNDEYFKGSLVRYLSPANHHPARIIKSDKDFAKMLNFSKLEKFTKLKKNNSIGISVFDYGNKETHPIYVSKKE